MPLMRVTQLGVGRLYLTRQMIAGDEVEIEPQCVDAARALGYVEDLEQVPPPRGTMQLARPGATKEKAPKDMTRPELLAMAEEKGIDLPGGYVPKDDLVELVEKADDGDDAA